MTTRKQSKVLSAADKKSAIKSINTRIRELNAAAKLDRKALADADKALATAEKEVKKLVAQAEKEAKAAHKAATTPAQKSLNATVKELEKLNDQLTALTSEPEAA